MALSTAPLDATFGEQIRHRLFRAGNHKVNHMLYIAAVRRIRLNAPGRAYYRRILAAGKTGMDAIPCLKRCISDAVYRQLLADATAITPAEVNAGPGGHCAASHVSSAAGSNPRTGTSDQPLPRPAAMTLPATRPLPSPAQVRLPSPRVDAAEPSRCRAPPDERPWQRRAPAHTPRSRIRCLDNRREPDRPTSRTAA